ncbi:hypothetical protein XF_1471 [Xylella fastidiosa 9a5c]|uniref:Uncharacterized protein n=1 Tax=Xylella fastidiosa (strain 9a5c) TaxID=160492 RepID=Q9PDA8_XYLFA|nr:hypothetical protein XF_1471 [Xylella fastidiosa 9a5c]
MNPRSVGYCGRLSLNRAMVVLDDKVRGVAIDGQARSFSSVVVCPVWAICWA